MEVYITEIRRVVNYSKSARIVYKSYWRHEYTGIMIIKKLQERYYQLVLFYPSGLPQLRIALARSLRVFNPTERSLAVHSGAVVRSYGNKTAIFRQ